MVNSNETTLAHYGVKGMRWGVRKDNIDKSRALSARQKQRLENDKKVHQARATQKRAGDTYEKATLDYLNSTTSEGRRAAEKVMDKAFAEAYDPKTVMMADSLTSGEARVQNLASAGAIAVGVALLLKAATT